MGSDLLMAALAAFSLWMAISGIGDLIHAQRRRKLEREPWCDPRELSVGEER